MGPKRLDGLDKEVADYLDRDTEDRIARGVSPAEARRAAHRDFGSVSLAIEDARAVWIPVWRDQLWQDVTYAFRTLRRHRGFACVAISTLALGIGANVAIFSLVYGVLLRPLPYPDGDRLLRVSEYRVGATSPPRDAMLSQRALHAWQDHARTLEGLAPYTERAYDVTGAGDAERVRATAVAPQLFQLLGVKPAAGRFFEPGESLPGQDRVVVLSHDYWRQHFGERPGVIGQVISLDGQRRSIIGIAPEGFSFPDAGRRLFTPFVEPRPQNNTGPPPMGLAPAIARLAFGSTASQAEAEGTALLRGLGASTPAADLVFGGNGPPAVRAVRLVDQVTAPIRPLMLVLMTGSGMIFLVSCANVANLLLFRSLGRRREYAIRTALGAGRARLVRQLLTESAVTAMLAGTVGTVLAMALIRFWPSFAPPSVPRLDQVHPDGMTMLSAAIASAIAGLVLGAAAALSGTSAATPLVVHGVGGDETSFAHFARRSLLVAEAALTMVLLVGAALMVRSVNHLLSKDPGYDAQNVVMARISLQGRSGQQVVWQQLSRRLLERLRAEPGIQAAGVASMAPLGDSTYLMGFRLDPTAPTIARALGYVVSPGYAEVLRLRLRSGRLLSPDDEGTSWQAMVVNEQFVRSYLNDGRPALGRQYSGLLAPNLTTEIVGVVADVLKNGLLDTPQAELYVVSGNHGLVNIGREINVVLRTTAASSDVAVALTRIAGELDGNAPVHNVTVLAKGLSDTVADARFGASIASLFGALSVALAAFGLTGLLSYDVARRRAELGIRLALGATSMQIVIRVMKEGFMLATTGVALGLVVAFALARPLRGWVAGLEPLDGATCAVAAVVLLLVAIVASAVPAWRAGALAPAAVLRNE